MNERVVLALTAVIVLMVVLSSQSNIPLSSADPGPQLSPGARFPLFTLATPIHLNDSLNKVRQTITDSELPVVLADGLLRSRDVEAEYVQFIRIGSSPLIYAKEPNSDYDPRLVFRLGTSPSNVIYNLTLVFSQSIDLAHGDFDGQSIFLFGKKFVIDNQTTEDKLVLSDGRYSGFVLQEGEPVKQLEDGLPIEGTSVSFRWSSSGNLSSLTFMTISVFSPDSDLDALGEREKFVDPVFGTFMLDFTNMSFGENSSYRENFNFQNSGDDKLTLSMAEHRGFKKTVEWLLANGSSSILADARGNKIVSVEDSSVPVSGYLVMGDGPHSYLMQVATITNLSNGFNQDKVILRDVFSGQEYRVAIASEGLGYFAINGELYEIAYSDKRSTSTTSLPAHIRVSYPFSLDRDLVVYPVIRSSKWASIAFYEPVTINVTNVSGLRFFSGPGYDRVAVNLSTEGNFFVNGLLVDSQHNRTVSMGPVSYEFTRYSPYTTRIYLRDVSGNQVRDPALVIFEGRGRFWEEGIWNALIVKTEGLGTNADGVGVDDVEMTWGSDMTFDEIRMATNPNLYKSMDRWGTMVTTDRTDPDQYRAIISYPSNQSAANIYIVELI